jgi:hypothetical protein
MRKYEFALKFALPSRDVDIDDCIERLGDGGCDDTVIGIGQKGRIALGFIREAASAQDAVLSGIADVRHALPEAALIEASPDLVGLTDVAELLHVSRQNVRKLILDGRAPAPAPVHEGKPTIWRLAKVLAWLREQKSYRIDEDLVAVAKTTMQVNLAIDQRDADAPCQSEIHALLA